MSVTIHTAATSHKITGLTVTEALALQEKVTTLVKVVESDV